MAYRPIIIIGYIPSIHHLCVHVLPSAISKIIRPRPMSNDVKMMKVSRDVTALIVTTSSMFYCKAVVPFGLLLFGQYFSFIICIKVYQ